MDRSSPRKVIPSQLEDKHLALMWASPSLMSVKDALRTYERPADVMESRFVEDEVVRVLGMSGRWVVESAGEDHVERLRHASGSGMVLSGVPFAYLTALNPGWHEVDVALAVGFQGSCGRALGLRGLGWVLRRRVEEILG